MNELPGADVPNATFRNYASAGTSTVRIQFVAARCRPELSKWSHP